MNAVATAPAPSAQSDGRPRDAHYLAGFLFSDDLARVALIEKRKPAWQA